MKNNNLKLKIAVFALGSWLLALGLANAQAAPEFLVSWRAFNYVPADYQGKIFPIANTPVKVSFDLVDRGKITDLSKISVSWFLDGDLFQSGKGLKSIIFSNGGSDRQIRILISGYREADIEKIVIMPAVRPEIVIDARFPSSEISIGRYQLETKPYFFNVSDLTGLIFNWFLNGEPVTGAAASPQFLDLNLESAGAPQKTGLYISANVTSRADRLETASKLLNLTVR